MFRRLCNRALQIQSQICLNFLNVYSSNQFRGFLVNQSAKQLSVRWIGNSSERQTKTDITFDSDPNVSKIEMGLGCSRSEAMSIYTYLTKNEIEIDLKSMSKIVKWLHRLGADTSIISKNCHLFSTTLGMIRIFNIF